jgi:hypothetical protein
MGEAFVDQDVADVPPTDRQRSTKTTVVAIACAFLSGSAGARHGRKPAFTTGNEDAQSVCGSFGEAAFSIATRPVATLRRVEANETVRRAIEAHGIAVDHVDLTGLGGPQNLDAALVNSDVLHGRTDEVFEMRGDGLGTFAKVGEIERPAQEDHGRDETYH